MLSGGGVYTSCDYDDSGLWEQVRNHEDRIAQLETLCDQMNTNISSLQTIVTALQGNDYVTAITPISSGGETIGYTLNFSKSGPVTIYHGEDGKDGANGADGQDGSNGADGHTPIIGVKMTSDGNYYWTVDGSWLLDEDGNKVRANGIDGQDGKDGVDGTNGQDGVNGTDGMDGVDGADGQNGADGINGQNGITPQLKIENDLWYVSYDNGGSWIELGQAKGDDGQDGTNGKDGADGKDGDSMFSTVTYDKDFVYLALADGVTTLTVPRKGAELDILFPEGNEIICSIGETISIPYTLTFGDENTEVVAIPYGSWTATVAKDSNVQGTITVTVPSSFNVQEGEGEDVIILVNDGNDSKVKRITFIKGTLVIVSNENSYENQLGSEQTTLTIDVSTNLDYTVSIPKHYQSWISLSSVQTKSAMRDDVVTLNIAANISSSMRFGDVELVNSANYYLGSVFIVQAGSTVADNELFYRSSAGDIVDPDTYYMTATIVSNSYSDGKGVIAFDENLTQIWENSFKGKSNLIEMTMPKGVTTIASGAFAGCDNLCVVEFPEDLTTIGTNAFASCKSLSQINIPVNVTTIGSGAFEGCIGLTSVDLRQGVTTIGSGAFEGCTSLRSIGLPNRIGTIESRMFAGCSNLSGVSLPSGIASIGTEAFCECTSLSYIGIPTSVTSIMSGVFTGCTSIQSINIPANVTSIGYNAFSGCTDLQRLYLNPTTPPSCESLGISTQTVIYVPTESVELYKSASGWSAYASQIEGN